MIASLEPAVAVPIAFLPLGIFHKFATVAIGQTRSLNPSVGRTHRDATAMDSLSLRILVKKDKQMARQDVRQDTRPGPRRSEDGYQNNAESTQLDIPTHFRDVLHDELLRVRWHPGMNEAAER